MELSEQTDKILKPKEDETFFDKYVAGEKTKGMFNPTAKDVIDAGTDFIPGVSETKDIISLGTNVSKGQYASAGIDLASLVLGAVPILGDVARRGLKTLTKNVGKSEDVISKQADEVGESLQKVYGNIKPPTKTVKAYKLFKADKKGNLYPLFVKMQGNKPLELNKWTKAEAGEVNPKTGKVKSSLGDLAYRPGFHGGDLPIATHIGGKKGKVTKPNYRKDNQVWAEVEFGDDVDWQSVANSRALKNKDGSTQVKTAHITDQVPEGGVYRYKTNPNMTGNWLIGGELKINRILPDKEVKKINDKAGVADLPRLKDLKLAEGGTVMKKQMEMFEDGGLKDEGGMIDEVSGNDVPSGSTREEVRDDIPAQLSEGEFVFPADVVRFIGLAKLMQLRQEAKQGLKQMEAMGQMGNSDEATMPDDLPFDETDLDIEDDMEYNRGGVVQAQQGAYIQPAIPTANTNTGMAQPQTGFAPVQYTTSPFTGNPQNVYNPQGTQYAPASYQDLLGASAGGAPQTKNVRYFNKATNQVRMIPHLLNPDGSVGDTLYPIPDGFVREDEAPKEEAKKTKVESTKVKPAEAGDGGSSDDANKGGATLSFGGTPDPNKPGLQKNAITANISYNVSALGGIMGLTGGLSKIADINKGKDVETIGNQYGKTTKPVEMSLGRGKPVSVTSKTYASIKNSVYGKTAKDMKDRLGVLDSIASREYTFNADKNQYTDKFGNTLSLDETSQAGKDINDYIDQEISKGKSLESVLNNLSDTEKSIAQDDAIEQEDDSDTDDSQNTGGFDFSDNQPGGGVTTSTGIGTDIDDDDDSYQDNDSSSGGYSDSDSNTGGGGEDTGGGSMCVIATHGISTGGFTPMEKTKAELWCQKTYHGKWYGEAFRRGYRAWGIKHINNGTAPQVYQEFKDFVSCGRGIKKGFKLKLHYYLRTLHLFTTGLFIKR